MKLDYTPPGWDAPLSEVIADLRTSIETIRELDSFLPLGTELGRELDNIAARVTNLVDVFALVSPLADPRYIAALVVARRALSQVEDRGDAQDNDSIIAHNALAEIEAILKP